MKSNYISRRTFLIGGGLSLLTYLYFEISVVAIKKYTIPIYNLPSAFNGFTILQLSDLHSKEYGANQEKLLDIINTQQFDLVALTGDFVNASSPDINPAIHLITNLISKPVFFVPGNHEWRSKYVIRKPLLTLGVQLLENRSVKITKDAQHIWLVGVDDPYLHRDKLNVAVEQIKDSSPKILLAHAPSIFASAIKANFDLVMVGHTHGGQIRLPFVGAIVAPGQGLFPKFDYGLFTSGRTNMIINGGLGESSLPVRFNNRPEIVLITLTRA